MPMQGIVLTYSGIGFTAFTAGAFAVSAVMQAEAEAQAARLAFETEVSAGGEGGAAIA